MVIQKIILNRRVRIVEKVAFFRNCKVSFYLQAAVAWLRHDVKERRVHVAPVLENVRFCLLSPKFLVNIVCQEPLVKGDETCREILDRAKNYLLLPTERSSMQGIITKPRKPILRGEVLFAVGEFSSVFEIFEAHGSA